MSITAFNTAAKKSESYVFDLDREVAAFYCDHPEQKNNIFFADMTIISVNICRSNEADKDKISYIINSKSFQDECEKAERYGSLAYRDGNGYGIVILDADDLSSCKLLGYTAGEAIAKTFTFDHEIGHLLCEGGYPKYFMVTSFNESVADAYATLRHIQRFGKDSPALQGLIDRRAVEVVFSGYGDHYSIPVVEKIIADAQTIDFSALTPAETAERAYFYASKNAILDVGNNMAEKFRNSVSPYISPTALRELGDFILKTTDPQLFKVGAIALCALLDGDFVIRGDTPWPTPKGRKWTRLRKELDKQAAIFSASKPKLMVNSQTL